MSEQRVAVSCGQVVCIEGVASPILVTSHKNGSIDGLFLERTEDLKVGDRSYRWQHLLAWCSHPSDSATPIPGYDGIRGLILAFATFQKPDGLQIVIEQAARTIGPGFIPELIALCMKKMSSEQDKQRCSEYVGLAESYAKRIILAEDADVVAGCGDHSIYVRLGCIEKVTDPEVVKSLLEATPSRDWGRHFIMGHHPIEWSRRVIDRAFALGFDRLIDDETALRNAVETRRGRGYDFAPYFARLAELEAAAQGTQA